MQRKLPKRSKKSRSECGEVPYNGKQLCTCDPSDYYDEEMGEHTENYATFVLEQIEDAKQYTDQLLFFVGQRLSFDDITPGGFEMADLIIATPKKLDITETKCQRRWNSLM